METMALALWPPWEDPLLCPSPPNSPVLSHAVHWPGQQGGFVSYSEGMCRSQGQGPSLGLEAALA